MSAGPQYEFLWADGVKVRTPVKLSAPDYINCLFDWVEDQVGAGGVCSSSGALMVVVV
jgi:MOB kinase activator 1